VPAKPVTELVRLHKVNIDKLIPNKTKSIKSGALAPHGPQKKNWVFSQLELIAERFDFQIE
jgi:excinuclease ABC subunit A